MHFRVKVVCITLSLTTEKTSRMLFRFMVVLMAVGRSLACLLSAASSRGHGHVTPPSGFMNGERPSQMIHSCYRPVSVTSSAGCVPNSTAVWRKFPQTNVSPSCLLPFQSYCLKYSFDMYWLKKV